MNINPNYTVINDQSANEMIVKAGDGEELYRESTSETSVDYKQVIAEALVQEYETNGVSNRYVEMQYVITGETYTVTTVE